MASHNGSVELTTPIYIIIKMSADFDLQLTSREQSYIGSNSARPECYQNHFVVRFAELLKENMWISMLIHIITCSFQVLC